MTKNLFFRYCQFQAGIYKEVIPKLPTIARWGATAGFMGGCFNSAFRVDLEDTLLEMNGKAPLTPLQRMARILPSAAAGAAKWGAISVGTAMAASNPLAVATAVGVAACVDGVERSNKNKP